MTLVRGLVFFSINGPSRYRHQHGLALLHLFAVEFRLANELSYEVSNKQVAKLRTEVLLNSKETAERDAATIAKAAAYSWHGGGSSSWLDIAYAV